MQTAELNRYFGIPDHAEIIEGQGGLPFVRVRSAQATGEMYIHGAHVTSWIPNGQSEVLFLSDQSIFQSGRAIRGGIPICFPWFGPKGDGSSAPAHGFVRTKSWQIESIASDDDGVIVRMFTVDDGDTRSWWNAAFRLTHEVRFGAALTSTLSVRNTGTQPFTFEAALHTYYRVADVAKVRVTGLDKVEYLDKVNAGQQQTQHGDIILIGETDRVYLKSQHGLTLHDPILRRRIEIQKHGSNNSVVWNPWAAKANALADLGNNEWRQMLCLETANLRQSAVTLHQDEVYHIASVSLVEPI